MCVSGSVCVCVSMEELVNSGCQYMYVLVQLEQGISLLCNLRKMVDETTVLWLLICVSAVRTGHIIVVSILLTYITCGKRKMKQPFCGCQCVSVQLEQGISLLC